MFLLRHHGLLKAKTKNMAVEMTKQKFVGEMLVAHKKVLADAWERWGSLIEADIERMNAGGKSELEENYPRGFYDFTVEFIDHLIAENNGDDKGKTGERVKPRAKPRVAAPRKKTK